MKQAKERHLNLTNGTLSVPLNNYCRAVVVVNNVSVFTGSQRTSLFVGIKNNA